MPDYFIPLDTTTFTKYHRMLTAKSVIVNASLRYIDNNRKALKEKYPTFEAFNSSYETPQSLIDEIFAEGAKQKVKPANDAEVKNTLPKLKLQLKALVARDIWDMTQYYQIMNEDSEIVKKAIQLMKTK
jgi:carboxyl-terminal processing protease